MQIEKYTAEDNALEVTLRVSKSEFNKARKDAYIDNTDHYPVPGFAGGTAPLEELEKTYGPAVLYDEALEKVIPEMFSRFLAEKDLRIMGRPQMTDMSFADGGVVFDIKADLYPEVRLGQYRGIAVPYKREGEQDRFEAAVLQKACENMEGMIPKHMAEQKLDSIIAREKLNVSGEAIYHLLADADVILKRAYEAAGASRPSFQIKREALDLVLQTVSEQHQKDWQDFFFEEIRIMAGRYHDLPEGYDETLRGILQKRISEKNSMEPETLTEEIFRAYLGSLELSESQWREQRFTQAAREACIDLLLDSVADEENITVSAQELHEAVESIAARCNMSAEQVENEMDMKPLEWSLRRDKARALILDSAVTDEKFRAEMKEAAAEAAGAAEE